MTNAGVLSVLPTQKIGTITSCVILIRKKGPERCSSHYIMYDELYEVVLRDIQQLLHEVRNDKEKFLRMVMDRVNADDTSEDQRIEQEIESLQSRISELEAKFDRLYDDRLDGLLSDKKFKELSSRCEAEQENLNSRLEVLKAQRDAEAATERDVEEFMQIAEDYWGVTNLDKQLLNRLVESIVIGERTKNGAGVEQEIAINYRFVGQL